MLFPVDHAFVGETLPSATLIGSPNFGYRSVEKDLEAQITIVTTDTELRSSLHKEQQKLFDSSSIVSQETFQEKDRLIPNWVKVVVATARNFFWKMCFKIHWSLVKNLCIKKRLLSLFVPMRCEA